MDLPEDRRYCAACYGESYTIVQKLTIIDAILSRYGFYNYTGSDPITGIGSFYLRVIYPYDEDLMDDDDDDEDRGVALYYLDPPVWRRQVMIRNEEGHFVYQNTEGHLVVRTRRYHSLGPPYCSC